VADLKTNVYREPRTTARPPTALPTVQPRPKDASSISVTSKSKVTEDKKDRPDKARTDTHLSTEFWYWVRIGYGLTAVAIIVAALFWR